MSFSVCLLVIMIIASTSGESFYRDCQETFEKSPSSLPNGVYLVRPQNCDEAFEVYCEKDGDGKVWTRIQHREDGSVDFGHNWLGYKNGFGDVAEEFWLGNQKIHLLTNQAEYQIKFEMTDVDVDDAEANYRYFYLEDESDKYRLRLGDFTGGNAGNAMNKGTFSGVVTGSEHNNQQFTTIDSDNDNRADNCAIENSRRGGWWYDACDNANFNAKYYASGSTGGIYNGIEWRTLTGSDFDSMITTTMKIHRKSLL